MNCTGSVREFITPQTPKVKISSHGRRVPLPASIRLAVSPNYNSLSKNDKEHDKPSGDVTSTALIHGMSGGGSGGDLSMAVVPMERIEVAPVIPSISAQDEDDYLSLEVLRYRYALFVGEIGRDANQYHSPSVLAESVLKKMLVRTNVSRGQKVAAATWALEILALSQGNDVIRSIRNELIPAIYMDYDPAKLFHVSTSVYNIVSNPSLLSQNPVLSHNMFIECRDRLAHEAVSMNRATTGAALFHASRKRAVFELIERLRQSLLAKVLFAWRKYTRERKVDRIVRRNNTRRFSARYNWMLQQIAFQSWRAFVERSRSTILAEKLHNSQFLLENAKNQFQIQCFRSDKHLRSVEELRVELEQSRVEKETIRARVFEIERQLQTHDEENLEKMNELANRLLKELSRWKQFARFTVEALTPNADLFSSLQSLAADIDSVNITTEQSLQQQPAKDRSSISSPSSTFAADGQSSADWLEQGGGSSKTDLTPDQVLLCWIQGILKDIAPHLTARNFATDFKSGEVMLLILHHVAPQEASLVALQETSAKSRVEKVVQACQKIGLPHVPRVRDFIECNSDVMFVTVADLFSRYVEQLSTNKAKQQVSKVYEEELLMSDTATALDKVIYDVSMLPSVLAEGREEMTQLTATEKMLRHQQWFLVRAQDTVAREAAFLTRERLEGNPVRAVGKVEIEKYYKLKASKFSDLELRYTTKREESWKDQLLAVRSVLEKHVYNISRLFKFYAGFGINLHEQGFWRLVTCTRLCNEKPLTKRLVEKIMLTVGGVAGAGDESVEPASPSEGTTEPTALEEILPGEFTEIIIRLADLRGGAAGPKTAGLAERVESLIIFLIKAHTKHLAGPENQFRRDFNDAAVQKVIGTYAKDLNVVFRYYCGKSTRFIAASTRRIPLLDVDQLHALLRDAGISDSLDSGGSLALQGTDDTTSSSALLPVPTQHTLAMIQAVVDDGGSDLTFFEVVELLAALSVYRIPNPFATLDRKVDVMMSHALIKLKSKLRGIVALSDIKLASLAQ